ncbi:hypothetical protein [Neobacillus soli]|uniref:hypothetical protein n=1 Tax=Neobacillus soli TaxID=220688 RepID=UPI001C5894CC|nr:hypothetical protein [Neobacillus soli]
MGRTGEWEGYSARESGKMGRTVRMRGLFCPRERKNGPNGKNERVILPERAEKGCER